MNELRYACTGPPGGGKTSVLERLKTGFQVVSEPARRVLATERASGGAGTGDQDTAKFVSLMLHMAKNDAEAQAHASVPVLFDRGLPDLIAFAAYYALPDEEIRRAVSEIRYAETVFWFSAWEDIYENDDERTLTFDEARAFGELIRAAYLNSGYQLLDVPLAPIADRAAFIRGHIT